VAKKRTIRSIPQQRTPMRELDARARAKDFSEVACGYSLEDALREAQRCLYCPDPACIEGCPVSIAIPDFIRRIEDQDLRGAYDVIGQANLLPAICGRVCPQESQCEGVCPVG
jgi:glutamate synthase (NADPH) small chain